MQPLNVKRNNYRRRVKPSNQVTPTWIAEFVASLFPRAVRVLDPCAGSPLQALLAPFTRRGAQTYSWEIRQGQNFFACTQCFTVDLVVCNPPFNQGAGKLLAAEVWLRKILEVVGTQTPIVLFVPMGFRLNQRTASTRWRYLRDNISINSIISLPLDVFPEVQFHAEILVINAPAHDLQAHYFLPDPPDVLSTRMAELGRRTSDRKKITSSENGRRAQSEEARAKMRAAWERRRERKN